MLRAEGIRVPGSKEASFLGRFYRIPCVSISTFRWERGLVYYCLLGNCGATASSAVIFRMRGLYRDKSYNTLVVIHATSRYRGVISRFS